VPRYTYLVANVQTVSGEVFAFIGNPTTLNNGDVLTYIQARTRWENAAPGGYIGKTTQYFETEFLDYFTVSPMLFDPWYLTTPTNGTTSKIAGLAKHPGITRFTSSTTTNDGYAALSQLDGLLISGGEQTDFIIRPQLLAGATIRMGFLDTDDSTAPLDGCYLEMARVTATDGVLVGKTANNSTRSTTGTSYTLVTNTWYQLRVVVNAAATLVSYFLYDESGAQLWTDTLATNIPTTAGRETGHGIIATNSDTSAHDIVDIDYMNLWINRSLTRI
jgi:hypothetical protein